jgi:non-lysosomal glucosylceramidase
MITRRRLLWGGLITLVGGGLAALLPALRPSNPAPGGISSGGSPPMTPATAPLPAMLHDVPEAAWRRVIGQPAENPARNKVNLPYNGDDGPWQGAPLGGMGAGSIGRTYRGDFARWHLAPGENRYGPVWADAFSVRVARPGATPTARVLMPGRPRRALSSWGWNYPATGGTYAALYPFAWYGYDPAAAGIRLQSRQFSPVIPGNYRESSYPVAIFEWTVTNDGDTPADVSLMFTWENPLGWNDTAHGVVGNRNRLHRDTVGGKPVLGVLMSRDHADGTAGPDPVQHAWDGQFAIAAEGDEGVTLSALSRFDTSGEGADVWQPWAKNGRLPDTDDPALALPSRPIGGAVAASVTLAPGESRRIRFVLAWDLPLMEFGSAGKIEQWYRRYTEWFGTGGHNAAAIVRAAFEHGDAWAKALEQWQAPYLADTRTPLWYKTALFNELYFLVDGGTIWENGRPGDPTPSKHRFSYLECFDYPFYSTLDVRFYGSFAQMMLWPEIEKAEMREFADTIAQTDDESYFTEDENHRRKAVRKIAGAAPHDVGSPVEAPWTRINAYHYQDVNDWKDLNSKYVLLIYRDYIAGGDRAFLDECWPSVQQALAYLKTLDRDGDGIPENTGFPDQTYDTWVMQGVSAYCGSLWMAALEAGAAMADVEGVDLAAAQYRLWLAQAQPRFEDALWNGRYYNYDTGNHGYHDSIMADALAGQWYADATNLPAIVPADHARAMLETIYRFNVQGFADGQMGAVNGMRPDGTPDRSNMQSLEVWTGTTYGLAAFFLHRGMDDAAWATAYGIYRVTYETKGLWFRTPEAWDAEGNFRAQLYMRPQAIWAMQWALDRRDK